MTRNFLPLLVFLFLLGCDNSAHSENQSNDNYMSGTVQIDYAPKNSARGGAKGPELLEFKNRSVQDILTELTDLPVELADNINRPINLRYHFPGIPHPVAKRQIIDTLGSFLGTTIDTIRSEMNVLVLYPGTTPVPAKSANLGGEKFRIGGDTLTLFNSSVTEIVSGLNNYRSEIFISDSATCCFTVSVDMQSSIRRLQETLDECCGLRLEKERREVDVLTVR